MKSLFTESEPRDDPKVPRPLPISRIFKFCIRNPSVLRYQVKYLSKFRYNYREKLRKYVRLSNHATFSIFSPTLGKNHRFFTNEIREVTISHPRSEYPPTSSEILKRKSKFRSNYPKNPRKYATLSTRYQQRNTETSTIDQAWTKIRHFQSNPQSRSSTFTPNLGNKYLIRITARIPSSDNKGEGRKKKKYIRNTPRNIGYFVTRIVEQFPFDFTPALSTLAKIRDGVADARARNVYLHKLQGNQGARDICRRCISGDDKGGKYREIRAREFRVHDRAWNDVIQGEWQVRRRILVLVVVV